MVISLALQMPIKREASKIKGGGEASSKSLI